MSVNIVAFGNERDGFSEDNQQPSLIWSYLGRSALISQIDSSLSASHVGNPVFTEYQACVFGNVRLVVHDCPVWGIFDSDWYTSCRLIGGADIMVIKYSVNDKTSFQELKDSYVPMVKKALNHCSVPVIISAIGARKNGVPCTCPLCSSDRRSCVTTSEGVQLAKELGATYLELHTLNDFYIQKYFGGVLEYFMIQSLNQKSSEKMKKRKKTQKCHRVQPPQLEQPEKMPILKGEASHYNADLHNLLCCCQCADVAFYPEDLSTAVEAHKIILCSVSHLFMLLFGVKSPSDAHDASIMQLAQSLFAVEAGDPFPSSPRGVPPCVPPVRVLVKDSVFCSCLPDILHFIYSGAFQWERLEEDIKKKLKDPEKTEHVLEKVKCILKTPGKLNTVKDCRSHQIKRLYNTSLRLFFNTPVLADVIFKIQGATVPAHRAVLVARCEVMAAMFNGNYLEANRVLVPVYGVSKDTFLSFLEYLYTDSCCPASILQAMSLLICAEMYQVMRLQHICELYIITQLQSMPSRELASTSLSIVSLLKKAKFHNSDCLSTWLLHFIATNYLIFSQKPEFQELSGILLLVLKKQMFFCFAEIRSDVLIFALHETMIRVSLGYSSRMFHHSTVGSAHNMTQPAQHHHFFGSHPYLNLQEHFGHCMSTPSYYLDNLNQRQWVIFGSSSGAGVFLEENRILIVLFSRSHKMKKLWSIQVNKSSFFQETDIYFSKHLYLLPDM